MCCRQIPNNCVGTTCKTQQNYTAVCVLTGKPNASVSMELILALLPRSNRFAFMWSRWLTLQNLFSWWERFIAPKTDLRKFAIGLRSNVDKQCKHKRQKAERVEQLSCFVLGTNFYQKAFQFPIKQPHEKK